jgi:hypothetical protein
MSKAEIKRIKKQQLCDLKKKAASFEQDVSYHVSYQHYINFSNFHEVNNEQLIQVAGLAYSWMPTTISIVEVDLKKSVDAINNLISCNPNIDIGQIENAASFLGGSVIGLSKILHFIRPEIFPIYDTAIYCFIYGKNNRPGYSTVNRADRLIAYFQDMGCLKEDCDIKKFVADDIIKPIQEKYNYQVSTIRAIELAIFSRSSIREAST